MQTTVSEGFRLSPRQKQLWLAQPDNPNQVARCAVLIEGKLDARVVEEAFHIVIRRHDILRTTFHHLPGMKLPVQTIEDGEVKFRLTRLPASEVSPQDSEVEDLFAAHDQTPFDFERCPLIRASLLPLPRAQHLLLISLPSLCADAWSLTNLVREIGEAYAASLQDGQLADEVTQYVQFSEWQNELLEDEDEQDGKEFWRQQDFSALTRLTLPFEVQNPGASFTPRSIHLTLDAAIRQAGDELARKHETTLEVFLLACWQILLWRLLRKSDIVIGQTFHGRSYEELYGALGLFARELPIQCHFEETARFTEILKQCKEATREAYQWQDYFTWPASHSAAASHDYFPFAFEFLHAPASFTAASLSLSLSHRQVCTEPFKLKLSCTPEPVGLALDLEYDSRLLAKSEVAGLGRAYEQLVRSVLTDGERRIGELELMGKREREQVLVEWNETEAGYELERCVHELIEEQAEERGGAVAVVYEEERLTYAELNERANRLAHCLLSHGLQPDARVALLLERSAESVIALLAVLKAGAAYLPLDPALPTARLAFMLEDAAVQLLITHGQLADALPQSAVRLIRLDAQSAQLATYSAQNPALALTPRHLAYVIYTSGSTGRPKGVAVEHRQLLNYLGAIGHHLRDPTPASYAIISTFAADLGHTMIFPALCSGATLHVISQERAASGHLLAAYMTRHEVQCLKLVPSHLQVLLGDGEGASGLLPRGWLVLGGEALRPELVGRLEQLGAGCRVLNHYGPTETTVGVLAGEVRLGEACEAGGGRTGR